MVKPDETTSEEKLTKALNKLNKTFSFRQYAVRGFMTGIFQALGATIGFTLLILVSVQLIDIFGGIPIVSYILKQTKLDVIIENQIKKIEEEETKEVSDPVEVPKTTVTPTPTT